MVRRVEVLAIPARGEVHLGPQSAALADGEAWSLSGSAVEAADINGPLSWVTVVLSPPRRITSNHPEAIGENQWNDALVAYPKAGTVVAGSLLVIYSGVSPRNHLPKIVGALVVHVGNPVVAAVNELVAGRLGGFGSVHSSHGTTESIPSNNGMNMRRSNSRVNNRIRSLDRERMAIHRESVPIQSIGNVCNCNHNSNKNELHFK